MLRWIWDLLFTRTRWTIISKHGLYKRGDENSMPNGVRYVMQDQWGNIKEKDI